ncbi:type II toxin-antitoxin system VapC family toxin [Microbacterium pseudoresistens]|uniref:PIN domain nuclease of toxin-antitoxin system n=1 Tax=Microbacterium pseudoresistens TaxID=640634 RepID=A0A7Y9JNQ0_9MICO|nr:type II toxin-antitoxin system VapC family toxin [Microbacterium pseudoresistens]NYD53934.1 PIN domain nuclease of toxin-antitoxin system [Microbacterium pseudoresistens]
MLLDTHALLWLATDDARLGPAARALIASGVRVHYSAVSISEIAIKHMLGRMGLPGGERFPAVFDEMGLAELPFTARHASALLDEPGLVRHDPFDRFLLAQAIVERMPLLTADATLLSVAHPHVHDARA